jgi:EAL domain-containing protein (putative c-di-GMP-specific phosphodiesterase class I)/CheY-like chemotaxis protein
LAPGKLGGQITAKPKILVIDDEADMGELISAAAQVLGFQCTVTKDSITFMENLTPETTLVLLDLMMPGLDGIELLRLLGKRKCRANIVLMSGAGKGTIESAAQYAQVLGLSIICHLQKPFRLEELEEVLQRPPGPEPLPLVHFYPQFTVQRKDLQAAIHLEEFVVYYQPQIDIASGDIDGVEALVRWRHPKQGLIFPDRFISRMERFGLVDELCWTVGNRAMSDVRTFKNDSETKFTLSLNVSVDSLRAVSFPDTFVSIAEAHGVSPEDLTIEITETGLIKELSITLGTLTRLRMKGVKLSIDDFGIGYATMQQFKRIPATELKIDKSFIQEMVCSQTDRVVVQKIIEIGQELGMRVIAEGVETQEQLELLRSYGCDSAQGYLFSRPIPANELLSWLKTFRSLIMPSYPHDVQMIPLNCADVGEGIGLSQRDGRVPYDRS